VEETEVPRENHRPVTSRCQRLSHNAVLSISRHERDQKQTGDSDLVQSKGTKTICIIYIKLLKRKRYNDDDDEINPVDTD
jgi:hypothetical protein